MPARSRRPGFDNPGLSGPARQRRRRERVRARRTINLTTDSFGTTGRARLQDHRAAAPRASEPGKRPDVLIVEASTPGPRVGRPGHCSPTRPATARTLFPRYPANAAVTLNVGGVCSTDAHSPGAAARRPGRGNELAPVRERDPQTTRGWTGAIDGISGGSAQVGRRRPDGPLRRPRAGAAVGQRHDPRDDDLSGALDEVTIAITDPPPPQPAPAGAAECPRSSSTGSVGHRAGPGPPGSRRRVDGRFLLVSARSGQAGVVRVRARKAATARPLPPSHPARPAADVPHPDTALRGRDEDARHDHPAGRWAAGRGGRDRRAAPPAPPAGVFQVFGEPNVSSAARRSLNT